MREPASELERIEFRVDEDRPRPGIMVLTVQGEADLHVAPDLRDRIAEAVAQGTNELILDLTDTTFVDSMALGVMLGAMKRLRGRGGEVRLVVDRPDIRRIFEITLLDGVFPLHACLEDALAAGAEHGDA
jgi:anti-sigma B factor antagonist